MGQCSTSFFVRCFRTALSARELRSSTRYGARYNSTASCPTAETTTTQNHASLEKYVRTQEDASLRARPPHFDRDFFSTKVHSSNLNARTEEATTSRSSEVAISAETSVVVDIFPLTTPANIPVDEDRISDDEAEQSNIEELYDFLTRTTDAEAAWRVYEYLREVEAYSGLHIPTFVLRRLMLIIGLAKPHRRVYFLRLLNIANLLRQRNEIILVSEWNSLIACAARGQRRKRIEDYQASLHVFRDMIAYSKDIESHAEASVASDSYPVEIGHDSHAPELDHPSSASASPDIDTFHILLHIAVTTNSDLAVKHASTLLLESGLEPTQRTHAIMMAHYSNYDRNDDIRESMKNLLSTGMPIDPSIVNLCLWTFARQGDLDIAMTIYRSLQANSSLNASEETREALDDRLDRLIGFHIPHDVQPNHVTYRVLTQAMAYHGDLYGALQIFRDFMESPSNLISGADDSESVYSAIMPMYRALFLGFARHATSPIKTSDTDSLGARLASFKAKSSPWNLENFFSLFDTFMAVDPRVEQPNERLVYWIIVAVTKTSGSDMSKMWRVMRRIQETFNVRWRGRLRRILESTSQGLDTGHVVAFPDDIVKRGGSLKRSRGRNFSP